MEKTTNFKQSAAHVFDFGPGGANGIGKPTAKYSPGLVNIYMGSVSKSHSYPKFVFEEPDGVVQNFITDVWASVLT